MKKFFFHTKKRWIMSILSCVCYVLFVIGKKEKNLVVYAFFFILKLKKG